MESPLQASDICINWATLQLILYIIAYPISNVLYHFGKVVATFLVWCEKTRKVP